MTVTTSMLRHDSAKEKALKAMLLIEKGHLNIYQFCHSMLPHPGTSFDKKKPIMQRYWAASLRVCN